MGDVKLIMIIMPFIGIDNYVDFLFHMTIFGGALAVMQLVALNRILTLLVMQFSAATSLKFELSDMTFQIGRLISNRHDVFSGNLSRSDINKISKAFHLEERNISIFIEELEYGDISSGRQNYNIEKLYHDLDGRHCDIDKPLSVKPVINAFNKYHSVYRVTLCRHIESFNTLPLPDELYDWFEIKFSSAHYGIHH